MSWIYVIVGILCLIALQFLRGALSMAFPAYSTRAIPRPDETSFGGLDMIDAKTDSLSALGFSGPAWVGADPETADANGVNAHAVYRNAETGVVAWVGPTIEVAHPNCLLTYYTTLLADGRFAVTQVSDPYFSVIDDPQTPAQTIAGADETTELAAHSAFAAELGVPMPRTTPQQDVLQFAGEHMTAIRGRMLERGKLQEAGGIARPSLSFAIKILGKMLTRPKPAAADELAVPTSRLPFLARMVELSKKRAPSQGMQWTLLLISAALFVGIGWPFLGLQFTLIVLGVIVLHEGGHWLAMRLYGYENPHITLLPLLGGVTIGHENDPSATKRAWVALAGPLPGIVLGWLLLFAVAGNLSAFSITESWLIGTIVVLLFVNYLNVLPIPPLDGAHVTQAIVPPRWAGLQAIVVILGIVLGVYVAYLLDFWPLALIAALQLPAVRAMVNRARLVREFSKTCPEGDDTTRRAWLFEALHQKFGNPKVAAKRIGLANDILHSLAVEPMGRAQRVLVTTVYAALLIVPLGALVLTLPGLMPDAAYTEQLDNDATMAEFERIEAEAAELDLSALIDSLAGDDVVPTPAGAPERLGVEARLGRPLPAHLAAFYDLANGLPGPLGLAPVSEIQLIDSNLFETGDLSYYVYEGALYFYGGETEDLRVPVEDTRDWWQVGYNEDWLSRVFVDPDAATGQPAVFQLGEETAAYHDIKELLRQEYLQQQHAVVYEALAQEAEAQQRDRLQGMDAAELMRQFRKPGMLERLITGEFFLPGPADEVALAAVEARIGQSLPADHRAALGVYDGYLPAMLLSAEDIQRASNTSAHSIEFFVEAGISAGYEALSRGHLQSCWVVGGNIMQLPDQESAELHATLIWCPDLPIEHRYLSSLSQAFYPTFREALLEHAIRMSAF